MGAIQKKNRTPTHSPLPEGATEAYRFNPYDQRDTMTHLVAANPPGYAAHAGDEVSMTTPMLHGALLGQVSFHPFPTMEYAVPSAVFVDQTYKMDRLFFGQLPYCVTDMEMAWLTGEFARGAQVFHTERIMKKTNNGRGSRMPTGCVHTYCDRRDVAMLIFHLNKRVMFDDAGIWYAENDMQKAALDAYCLMLKENSHLRPADRPYQPVVVQTATSTYVPHTPAAKRATPVACPVYEAARPPAYSF